MMSHVYNVTTIVLPGREIFMNGVRGKDKELLSFISRKREQESSLSILVTRNSNQS
jgi:hypothetical protein